METISAERSLLSTGSEAPHSHLCLVGCVVGQGFLIPSAEGKCAPAFDVVWINTSHDFGGQEAALPPTNLSLQNDIDGSECYSQLSVTCLSPVLTSQIKKKIRYFWARQPSKFPLRAVLEQTRSRLKKKLPLQSHFADRFPTKIAVFLIETTCQSSRTVTALHHSPLFSLARLSAISQ